MSIYRTDVKEVIVDDVRIVLLEETVRLTGSDYVSYVILLYAYDARSKEFSDLFDEFSFVNEEDALRYLDKLVNGWEDSESVVD